MSNTLSASLIICTYNREELFVNTVKFALKQNYPKLEILIVDQTKNHKPETSAFLEEIKDRVRYFYLETPSITKARNVGLKNATGDILIYIDDDTEFDEKFIAHHIAAFEEGYDVVQGRVIENERHAPHKKAHWLSKRFKFSGSDNCDVRSKTNVITGCNFSVRRTVAEAVGGFDERFTRLAIREDTDFGYRCYKGGYRMILEPAAVLKHLRSDTGGVGSGIGMHFFSDSYYYNEILFCRKHFGKLTNIYYLIRLKLRGRKALRKLIQKAKAEAENQA